MHLYSHFDSAGTAAGAPYCRRYLDDFPFLVISSSFDCPTLTATTITSTSSSSGFVLVKTRLDEIEIDGMEWCAF